MYKKNTVDNLGTKKESLLLQWIIESLIQNTQTIIGVWLYVRGMIQFKQIGANTAFSSIHTTRIAASFMNRFRLLYTMADFPISHFFHNFHEKKSPKPNEW